MPLLRSVGQNTQRLFIYTFLLLKYYLGTGFFCFASSQLSKNSYCRNNFCDFKMAPGLQIKDVIIMKSACEAITTKGAAIK